MLKLAWALLAWPLSHALVLKRAELVHGYTILLLHFDSKATLLDNSTDACDAVLSAATLDTIGSLPTCGWLRDGQVFQVLLGDAPSIEPGRVVSTLASVLAAKDVEPLAAVGSLSVTVTSQLVPLTPTAKLQIWPPEATDCTTVVLSGALSTGAAGRPWRASWRFGAVEVSAVGLQGFLTAASASNSLSVELPKQSISEAIFGTPNRVHLEVVLEVTNWLNQSSTVTEVMRIDPTTEDRPLMFPASTLNRTIQSNQAVSFSVATRYADRSSCGTAVSLPSSLTESWYYLNDSTDSTWSTWLPLESVLSDSAREPWRVDLPAYSFPPGSSQVLKASASYGGQPREQVFHLAVAPASPPELRLSGPYAVTESCGFTLRALTWDPLAPNTTDLTYWWSCATEVASFDCRRLTNFGQQVWILTNGTGSLGQDLIVDGGQLTEGNYTFSLQVIRNTDLATVLGNWSLKVARTAKVSIALTPSWHDGETISVQGLQKPSSSAMMNCGSKDAVWLWALVEATSPFSILTTLGNASNGSEVTAAAAEAMPYDYLIPGVQYSYALLEQTEPMPTSLIEAEASGRIFARTVPFLADGPPAGGRLTCMPMEGASATTEFFITTSGWFDEDMENLSYSFYRFPLPSGVTLSSDGNGGVSVSGTLQPPGVEWKDMSSPNHWMNLGGICLGHSQLPLQTYLPVGQHMLAVVVQDDLGAVGSKFLAGPLVSASPQSTLELELEKALVSNNAEIILGTLEAAELSLSVEVAALTVAASSAALSETGLCQLSRVANTLLQNATPASGFLISQAMSTVFVDMAQIPSDGVDRLVEVVFNIATAYKAEVDEVVLRWQQLSLLVTQLGNAVLATVPRMGSRELSYVGSQGQGVEVYVAKRPAMDLLYDGLTAGGLTMPAYAFHDLVAYMEAPGCDTAEVQLTTWLRSNPYAWSNKTTHTATLVQADANVTELQIRHCLSDELLNLSQRSLVLELPLPSWPSAPAPEGYEYRAACAIFDPVKLHWTRDWVKWETVEEKIRCMVESALDDTMAFTTFYRPVIVPEPEESVNVGIVVVAILVFFLCMAGVAYSNSRPKSQVNPEPEPPEPPEPPEFPEPPEDVKPPSGAVTAMDQALRTAASAEELPGLEP